MSDYPNFGNNKISTLVDLVQHRTITDPEINIFTFLEDGEDQIIIQNYIEFEERVRAIAANLQKKYKPGDRMIMLYQPGINFINAFFGCLFAGMIAIPTYPPNVTKLQRSLPRFLSIYNDSKPSAILSTKDIIELSKPVFEENPAFGVVDWLSTEEISNEEATSWRKPEITEDSLAFLQYTSGSTALPKGVMVSHRNLLYNSEMLRQAFSVGTEDSMFTWLPAYHDMGLIGGIIFPIYAGMSIVLMSPLHFLQRPYRWLKAISDYKITISGSPNFGYDWCTRRIKPEQLDGINLSSWRLAFNGAEPVRPKTLKNFNKKFSDCGFKMETFYPCYGLAEATLFVSGGLANEKPIINQIDKDKLLKDYIDLNVGQENLQDFVGCGRNWPDQDIKIVNPESFVECESNQVGEIWVSGPHIAQGYWQNPEATEETFHAFIVDNNGPYLRTGDLGFFIDKELYIGGRLKDLIIIDGLNHYPQDIEFTIERCHPGIRTGFITAFSIEENNSERLVIVAEFKGEFINNLEEARNSIRQAVADEHEIRVHDIVLIKTRTIAKTANGKIQRRLCKAEYLTNKLKILTNP